MLRDRVQGSTEYFTDQVVINIQSQAALFTVRGLVFNFGSSMVVDSTTGTVERKRYLNAGNESRGKYRNHIYTRMNINTAHPASEL